MSVNETSQLHPSMDTEGFECFDQHIKAASVYLEYGCGGSSNYAAQQDGIKHIISIDTDVEWIEKVKKSIKQANTKIHAIHCDVGQTGKWGVPINNDKIANYWRYSVAPWELARDKSLVPDLVLIDGRFRVASFLYSLLCARNGTPILFDDYFDRPKYFVVEKFCKLTERKGRMAVFHANAQFSHAELVGELCKQIIITA